MFCIRAPKTWHGPKIEGFKKGLAGRGWRLRGPKIQEKLSFFRANRFVRQPLSKPLMMKTIAETWALTWENKSCNRYTFQNKIVSVQLEPVCGM